ncbi:MAG: 30S ribosomal protein S6e [Candidatus Diapherotrites archaeon CG11_big_fil_rev_8_21_14_0_20_37_9]|nr:MAG: 30S ribosomal protein S6e [Candidatus Diapherotrites archaeon CG11_big_fil_rev_8_21_14_0_20_37_9]
MNIVVSDPKTKKAYLKKIENAGLFLGKKIGEEVELGTIGLDGYKAKITGGSDKQGFPMRHDLEGTNRKSIYITENSKTGLRKKVTRRGNKISDETSQINLKVTKDGNKKLESIFSTEPQEKDEELSAKEKAVKESLANVGKASPVDPKDMKKGKKG